MRQYGEYDVESLLGKGAIGKVYLARHRRIGRRVALKVIETEQKFDNDEDRAEFYKRLQREAELCGSLQHPNIVTLYEVGYDGEVVSYLATEYVKGDSLLARLKRTRPLPIAEALSLAADILRGLVYAHANGVIHRDIKPANILLTEDGRAKIADFGIARPLDSSLTGRSSLLGTPNYMSPEQVKSVTVTTRADLFSTGVVLYELITGVRPFVAQDLSGILFNIVNLEPPLVSTVNPAAPERLALIVKRLLAKSPHDRYPNAAEALREVEELRGIIPHPDDMTTPLPTVHDEIIPWFRRPIGAIAFWGVSLALVGVLILSITTLRARVHREQPTVDPTHHQRALDAKRRALDSARELVAAGQYADAIARYDAYLLQYPQSTVARAERDEAQRLLDKHIAARTEVTTTAPRTQAKKGEPPKNAPSRWQRFKRWFRGE